MTPVSEGALARCSAEANLTLPVKGSWALRERISTKEAQAVGAPSVQPAPDSERH